MKKTLYNVTELAILYYELRGDKYSRDEARHYFNTAKKRGTLDKELLSKTLDLYLQKIKEDF